MLMLLNTVCLGFEIAKLVIFSQVDDKDMIRTDSTADNIYLALTAITLLKDRSYDLYNPRERARICFLFMLAWIAIPATYTVFLFQDLGSIPLICPQEAYHYKSKILNQACKIRMQSFLIMWSYTALYCLTVLIEIVRYLLHRNSNSKGDLENGKKEQRRSYHPLFSMSDTSTNSENSVSRDINLTSNNSHLSSCSTTSKSPLSRPKPTHNSLFSPPSHEPKITN
ncbi:30206_t:CDS:2 [Racocetra persica]|uniref:30206_t:CDS:1 n=1 Tax=Racocetra persica TaxID=160502 RepID=A0ACA9KQ30_9GLOM|nr:30206_t:CDS:2 [Racocetra persica]